MCACMDNFSCGSLHVLYYRKVLLKTKIYSFHLNLCIALLLSYITFVSGIQTATNNKVIFYLYCNTIATYSVNIRIKFLMEENF